MDTTAVLRLLFLLGIIWMPLWICSQEKAHVSGEIYRRRELSALLVLSLCVVRPGSGRFGVFEILIHFDVLLFVLLFVLYTLVLFKVGIVDKNRFAHPQASCVVVPQGGGLCIHRREAAALRKKKKRTVQK